jgi:hypothetical protein
MALLSPGVEVSVIDESFYTPAGLGTTPIVFVATRANKSIPSGTDTARGTTAANAGKVFTITSQRDLVENFGTPVFERDAADNPVHGGELNEYGLQAAYSSLGISSRAYIIRADVDLAQLTPLARPPEGDPANGTYWVDTDDSLYGVFEWNSVTKTFTNKIPLIINDDNKLTTLDGVIPKTSLGNIGSYAIVLTSDNTNGLYYKNSNNTWVLVGSNSETNFGSAISSSTWVSTSWQTSIPVVTSTVGTPVPGTQFTINGYDVTIGSNITAQGIASTINALLPQRGVGAKANGSTLELYADASADALEIDPTATALVRMELDPDSITITNNGTNYQVNDLIEVLGGSGTPITLSVGTITGGGIVTQLNIVNSGTYTTIPGTTPAITDNSVAGGGLAISIKYRIADILVIESGNDYTAAPTVSITGGGFTSVASATAVLDGDTVDSITVESKGAGYTSVPEVALSRSVDGLFGGIKLSDINTGTLATLGLTANTYGPAELTIAPHTQIPRFDLSKNPTGSVYIKTTTPNVGANWKVQFYNATTESWQLLSAPIYATAEAAVKALDSTGGKSIPVGSVFIESNYDHGTGAENSPEQATFKLYRRAASGSTVITTVVSTTTIATSTFQIKETIVGNSNFVNTSTITIAGGPVENVVSAISAAGLTNVESSYNASTRVLTISHKIGGEIKLLDGTNTPLTVLGFTTATTANLYAAGTYDADGFTLRASNWKPLTYVTSNSIPTLAPADGTLWYSSDTRDVDILVHNGTTWVGYQNYDHGSGAGTTDPAGPIVSALPPETQSDGSALVNGDIWVSTADIDRYGLDIYVWNTTQNRWILQDTTDQTTPTGWLFADSRWATAGNLEDSSSIISLLSSNYLDPDAPDPALYPEGMKLWNTRRSGFNVKRYRTNYINIFENNGVNIRFNDQSMSNYFTGKWVTASPNNENGSGSFGRFAQRGVVVRALKSLVDTNDAIRDTDTLTFNLIATPGYPELMQNMVAFNNDRGQTALVVGDTPFRLSSNATDLANWGKNTNQVLDNNEFGAVTYDEYLAMFYPSGFTTDNFGNNIVVPPSHIMLRTIISSDQKSYQWFAPAGIRRGGVDNVTSVGYLLNGEFQPAPLPQGVRDTMIQDAKINPIATLPGSGIVNFGNLTRARSSSALDRINVARLVAFVRRQLDILARPFLFEPNDRITRNEIKGAIESFLLELVGQRGVYDFLVVCDESNNTNARIDRNELWVDIAIEPVKAVEFIYIPIRLQNTGTISSS